MKGPCAKTELAMQCSQLRQRPNIRKGTILVPCTHPTQPQATKQLEQLKTFNLRFKERALARQSVAPLEKELNGLELEVGDSECVSAKGNSGEILDSQLSSEVEKVAMMTSLSDQMQMCED